MKPVERVGRLIESDKFPFEFISLLAEKESWRKEVHRPIYYLHKWWAKRLGSVYRALLIAAIIDENEELEDLFYRKHNYLNYTVLDPFMGSGVTVGEATKLGFTVIG